MASKNKNKKPSDHRTGGKTKYEILSVQAKRSSRLGPPILQYPIPLNTSHGDTLSFFASPPFNFHSLSLPGASSINIVGYNNPATDDHGKSLMSQGYPYRDANRTAGVAVTHSIHPKQALVSVSLKLLW